VAPKIAGRLEKLTVNIGDKVTQKYLVAVLDAQEYAREVEQARAEWEVATANAEQVRLDAALEDAELVEKVAQAEADLAVARASAQESRSGLLIAQREYERVQALREKKIASPSELDTAEAVYEAAKAKHEVAQAQVTHKAAALTASRIRTSENQKKARAAQLQLAHAQVAQKQAALKVAEVRLAYARIEATWTPGEGAEERFVGERFVDEGTMLKPNDPIVSVQDIDLVKAVVHVTERDYLKLKVGHPVTVTTDAVPGREFPGTVVRIAPALKESSRQARVEIEVANPGRVLKPGMFIRAAIELVKHDRALLVPRDALVRRGGRPGIFRADRAEGKARLVPLTTGLVEGESAEVLDPPAGLEGAEVVVLGHHLLEDGGAILLADEEPPGPAGPDAAAPPSRAPKPVAAGDSPPAGKGTP
jgi:RND family efflux transporter MFP subunit